MAKINSKEWKKNVSDGVKLFHANNSNYLNNKGKNNPMFGKRQSEKTKNKIRKKALGRKMLPRSDEYRKKLSDAHKGKPKSKKHIEKMRQTKLKKFKEGTLKVWNKGLDKNDKRVLKNSQDSSKTKNSKQWKETKGKVQSKKLSMFFKKYWNDDPKKHPNYICGKKGFVSKPQMELYLLIKEKYSEAKLEYFIKTKHSVRYADIAIPSLKLDIEYDGSHWHKNKEMDNIRDKHLEEVGWKTIRFNKNNVHLWEKSLI